MSKEFKELLNFLSSFAPSDKSSKDIPSADRFVMSFETLDMSHGNFLGLLRRWREECVIIYSAHWKQLKFAIIIVLIN